MSASRDVVRGAPARRFSPPGRARTPCHRMAPSALRQHRRGGSNHNNIRVSPTGGLLQVRQDAIRVVCLDLVAVQVLCRLVPRAKVQQHLAHLRRCAHVRGAVRACACEQQLAEPHGRASTIITRPRCVHLISNLSSTAHTSWPRWRCTTRCWMKERKGAMPVPRPTCASGDEPEPPSAAITPHPLHQPAAGCVTHAWIGHSQPISCQQPAAKPSQDSRSNCAC